MEHCEDGYTTYVSDGKMVAALKSLPGYIHYIGLVMRHGMMKFATRLEWEHFEPMTEKNDAYHITLSNWQGLVICIISVPMQYKAAADTIAAECGLDPKEGLLITYNENGEHVFPLSGSNVFPMEYVSGHPAYEAGFDSEEAFRKEEAECMAIRKAHGCEEE